MTNDEADNNDITLISSPRKRKIAINESSSDDEIILPTLHRKRKNTLHESSSSENNFIVQSEDENNPQQNLPSKTLNNSMEDLEARRNNKNCNQKLEELLPNRTRKCESVETSSSNDTSIDISVGTSNFIVDDAGCIDIDREVDQSSSGSYVANPVLERDKEYDQTNVMHLLSRTTPRDQSNTRNYMKQHGEYQLQVRSETNPAQYLSNYKRHKRYMRETYKDQNFKEIRGLEPHQDESEEWIERMVCGQKIKLRRYLRPVESKSAHICSIPRCEREVIVSVTHFIPCLLYDAKQSAFVNNMKQYGTEGWFCHEHYPSKLEAKESSISDRSKREDNSTDCSTISESENAEASDDDCSTLSESENAEVSDDDCSTLSESEDAEVSEDDCSTASESENEEVSDDDCSTPSESD